MEKQLRKDLAGLMGERLPEFKFELQKRGICYFQRRRPFGERVVVQNIQILFDKSTNRLESSVASTLDASKALQTQYSSSLINPHIETISLIRLMHNRYAAPLKYLAQLSIEDLTTIIEKYGVPFLDRSWNDLHDNLAIVKGLKYVDSLSEVVVRKAKSEIDQELSHNRFEISRVKNQTYTELKKQMHAEAGSSSNHIMRIPKTAIGSIA